MDFWAAARRNTGNVEKDNAATSGMRKHGRLKCSMAHCTIGEILDLSAGGMRVSSRMKVRVGETLPVTLITQNGPVSITCAIKWVKRSKLFWYNLGLEFQNVDATMRKAISEFARVAGEQEVLRPTIQGFIDDSKKAG